MSIKLKKNDKLHKDANLSDDIGKLNRQRDHLYGIMDAITEMINKKTEKLTQCYLSNIKQDRVEYDEDNSHMYTQAKKVDSLVNEYNNTQLLIELIEKKIAKLAKHSNDL